MKEDILNAYLAIKPHPAWLEIAPPTLFKLLRECGGDEWQPPQLSNNDDGMFMNVPILIRKHLIGWRVVSTRPSEDVTSETFSTATICFDPRTREEVRNYIASPDFDEAEQLRYEEHVRRRRG